MPATEIRLNFTIIFNTLGIEKVQYIHKFPIINDIDKKTTAKNITSDFRWDKNQIYVSKYNDPFFSPTRFIILHVMSKILF